MAMATSVVAAVAGTRVQALAQVQEGNVCRFSPSRGLLSSKEQCASLIAGEILTWVMPCLTEGCKGVALRSKCPSGQMGRFSRAPACASATAVDLTKVVPQADRVLIRLEDLPEKSAGGVLLPKSAVKFERYLVGEVLSVGKDAASIEKGQKVLFSDINAYEADLGTPDKICFCRVADLLAVVE